jgi:hypothetical protein
MVNPEFLDQSESELKKREEKKKLRISYEQAKERYGFQIATIDDNSVGVREASGRKVVFEFPMGDIGIDEYDKFIEQMRDNNCPLPPIENMRMTIYKPLGDTSARRSANIPNSADFPYSWEQHAEDHGISVDELKFMYAFAREELYNRFKSRLRRTPND